MMTKFLLPAILLGSLHGCTRHAFIEENYQRALVSGIALIVPAGEMEKNFDICDHFIVHYNMTDGTIRTWQSEAHFGGRFVLTMVSKVRLSDSLDEVVEIISKPQFTITEYTKIEPNNGGGYRIEVGDQFHFEDKIWNEFKVNLDPNLFSPEWENVLPIENFQALAKQISGQRIPIPSKPESSK